MKAAMNSALLKGLELNQLEIEQADIEMVLINELGLFQKWEKRIRKKSFLSDINMTNFGRLESSH